MKTILILLVLLSTAILAQTETTSKVPVIPTDYNYKSTSLPVLYDAGTGKYYYSTDLMSTGFYGATLIDGTITVTGKFHALQVLEDTVIDSLVSTKLTGDAHALILTAGTTLLLNNITRIKLTSGKVWAYKSE